VDRAQIDLVDLKINRDGEVPIGVQLAWALRARIGDGRLAPGQRLPGVRELAELVGINANTARSVYQRLEQEGLISSRQGTGTFVASVTQEPSAVGQIVADAARQARKTGVDPR
jgi:GntR family transcriptional regulator